MRRALVVAVMLTGCLPIPWRKTYVMWPGATITVVDEAGAPLPSASVRMARHRYPYGKEEEVRALTTDGSGRVVTKEEQTTLTVFPLMMHGVPGFSFEACAEAKGHASKAVRVGTEGAPVEIKLVAGSNPCAAKIDHTEPAKGTRRIESVEHEKGDDWKLSLVLRGDDPVRVGDRFGKTGAPPLVVRELVWTAPKEAIVPRATVRVEGDASSYVFGDVVQRAE